jgi:phage-related holin
MYLEAGRLHVRRGEKDEAINIMMEMVDVGVLIPEDLIDGLQDIAGRG